MIKHEKLLRARKGVNLYLQYVPVASPLQPAHTTLPFRQKKNIGATCRKAGGADKKYASTSGASMRRKTRYQRP